MRLGARTGAWAKGNDIPLPSGYTKYDYLEKRDWGVNIDTGLIIGDKYQVMLEGSFPYEIYDDNWFVGTWGDHWKGKCDFLIGYYQGLRCQCGLDTSAYYSTVIPNDGQKHLFGVMKDRFIMDDLPQTTYPNYDDLPYDAQNQDFRLFISQHTDGGRERYVATRRMYNAKFWDMDDVLVRDYVACTDNLGNACMFDLVNRTSNYAEGGSLYAGND